MNERWRVLVVDRDPDRSDDLRSTLEVDPRFRTAERVRTGREAAELLLRGRYDVAVISEDLPDVGPCAVIRALPPRKWPHPIVIGTRALPEGMDGYDPRSGVDAAGDLLDRVSRRLREPPAARRAALREAIEAHEAGERLDHLLVRHAERIDLVPIEHVDWVASAGNYVELHAQGRRHLVRSPLRRLTARLDPDRFVRIHRCAVVNVERVRDLEPTPQGDWKLRLDDGTRLRLSRRFREALDRIPRANGTSG